VGWVTDLALVLAQEPERVQELVKVQGLDLVEVKVAVLGQAQDWGPELGRIQVQAPVGELEQALVRVQVQEFQQEMEPELEVGWGQVEAKILAPVMGLEQVQVLEPVLRMGSHNFPD
jgi:hypothetical protein